MAKNTKSNGNVQKTNSRGFGVRLLCLILAGLMAIGCAVIILQVIFSNL